MVLPTFCLYFPTPTMIPIQLVSTPATKMKKQARHTTKVPCSQSEVPVLLGQRMGISQPHSYSKHCLISLTNEDFHHWCVMTSYVCEVLTYTCNVPTMHCHQEPSSGETPQEDSTPLVNEQYLESSIPDTCCGETPQHVDKTCHLSDPTSITEVSLQNSHNQCAEKR